MIADPHLNQTYGHVTLTAMLGRGAMGAVYRGWHGELRREVAVKVLLDQSSDRGHAKERFLREGRAAARIQHPHVVQVMDAGESNGIAYLVMELVVGHSLGRVLDETGHLPPAVAARIGAEVALGLAAIHAQGIIHRDIKPDNILIGANRRAKITDLGLAKQTDDPELNRLTATGIVVGTPLYVSPESIRDPLSATLAADIYSLGATLYHMLAGRPPFLASSPYEVMRAHLEARLQPLREVVDGIPPGLALVVERCLSKTARQRPTASELAVLLDQADALPAYHRRGLLRLVAAACALVLVSAVVAWSLVERAARAARADQAAITAPVRLLVDQPGAQVRVDGGTWQPCSSAPLRLEAGQHALEVRACCQDRGGAGRGR